MEFTGIFRTKDETLARRVLTQLKPLASLNIGFIYKDGVYEIVSPEILNEELASQLNRSAVALAHTDLKAMPLQNFTQYEY